MSYTPTDWEIGDVITAEKMNKLEQAVAGGGGISGLLLIPVGFSNLSHVLGFLNYFVQDEGDWYLVGAQNDVYWGANNPASYTLIDPPASSGLKVFWAIYPPALDEVHLTFSGDINSTATTVYNHDGNPFNGYELTGLACVTAVAL